MSDPRIVYVSHRDLAVLEAVGQKYGQTVESQIEHAVRLYASVRLLNDVSLLGPLASPRHQAE